MDGNDFPMSGIDIFCSIYGRSPRPWSIEPVSCLPVIKHLTATLVHWLL